MAKKENNVGYSSRKKKAIIEEAMNLCTGSDMFNKFKICEQVAELMVNRYSGKNLDYHSKRMGLETNKKILEEIDSYFYKNLDAKLKVDLSTEF